MTRPEIASLTGVRGLAAALVMVDHYAAVDFTAPFPLDMLPHMYLAVDMFMILSGFILAMTYGERLAALPWGRAYRLFLRRRIARLYPMYALTTLVCFVLCRAGWLTFLNPDTSFAALLANLLAMQTWSWPGNSLNGPGWSISTEWFANLVFPLLIPLLLGRSARLAACLGAAGLALLVFSAVTYGQLFDVPSPGAVNTISGPGALGRCLGEFVMGMYCWRLRRSAGWTRLLRGDAVQLGLLALLVLLMQGTVLDTVAVLVCALLLIGVSFECSATSAVLRSAPLLWLGAISYSVYLLHITLMPVRDWLAVLFRDTGVAGAGAGAGASWGLAVICCSLATLGLATLARRFVERPAQAAINAPGWDRARRPAAPPSPG